MSRVFYQKLRDLMNQLTRKDILGKVIAYTYVVVRQKRGLPHVHVLSTLGNEYKIRTNENIDKIVSAIIPDPLSEPKLFEMIKQSMVHGPCGPINPNSQCMENVIR